MATWQYTFYVVPKAAVIQQYGSVPGKLAREVFDTFDWGAWQFKDDLVQEFDALLPRFKGWSANALDWGDEDGNHLQLWLRNDRVDELRVRIDVRTLDVSFINEIVELFQRNNCLFVLIEDELRVIEPRTALLIQEIKGSIAFQFVSDPNGYLKKLARNRHRKL